MDNKAINAEIRRLNDLLSASDVPKLKRDALEGVVNEIAWQRVKLEDTRKLIADAAVVCEYQNGETQKGTHENPLFRGYNALYRSYMQGVSVFLSYLPKDLEGEVVGEGVTALDKVIAMRKVK